VLAISWFHLEVLGALAPRAFCQLLLPRPSCLVSYMAPRGARWHSRLARVELVHVEDRTSTDCTLCHSSCSCWQRSGMSP
jgi:hypothetical protein